MIVTEKFEINGLNVSFARYGSVWKETAVLFFHGFTGSKKYIPDLEELTDTCIISFDRPGVGESDVQDYYTMEDFFTCINEVLDYHGVKKLRLIGHSAGGYYAQVYAQNNSDRVEALSLVSSMIPYNCPETKSIIDSEIKRNNFLTLRMKAMSKYFFAKAARSITENFDSQFEAMLNTLSGKEREYIIDNYELVKEAIINASKNDGLGIYYDAYALCQKRDKVSIDSSIPVFVWNGTKDDTTSVLYAEFLAKKYGAKETHIIVDAGHMMYLMYWKDIVLEVLSI